ncbi:MAG: gamma-butyrobetaine hydroxylase-like domain-containing protein [Fluviibacter sp.]
MAGLQNSTPVPEEIRVRSGGKTLALSYPDLGEVALTAEFLRVYSPSAEVRGHGQGNEVLQIGKEDISITGIEPVGNYAVKLIFSDGHDSGLYSWDILHEFASNHQALWQSYLQRLQTAGHKRKA